MRMRKRNHAGMPPSSVEALHDVCQSGDIAKAGDAPAHSSREDGRGDSRNEPLLINKWGVSSDKPGYVLSDVGMVEHLSAPNVAGNLVVIDWCSITFVPPADWQRTSSKSFDIVDGPHVEVFQSATDLSDPVLSDADLFAGLLSLAQDLGGWTFTESKEVVPAGFRLGKQYDKCVVCGFGGVGSRVILTFTGQAFVRGDYMMPRRIYDFIGREPSARITRLDKAFDDFDGSFFCPYQAYRDWQSGQFDYRGVRPKLHTDGDFHRADPENKGVSVYIGSAGKQLVIYQKGKQLGNPDSPYVRAEVRISQNGYSITRDALINPTAYFCGAYPYLALRVANLTGDLLLRKFEGVVREGSDSIDRVLEIIKHQYGKHLYWLREHFYGSDAELLDAIVRNDGKLPPVLQKAQMLLDRGERLASAINEKPPF